MKKIKEYWTKFTKWVKTLYKRFKKDEGTPVPATPEKPIVDVSKPIPEPVLKPTTVEIGGGNRISNVTAAFLGVSNGKLPEAPQTQPGGPVDTYDWTGYVLERKGHPYVHDLVAGRIYEFKVPVTSPGTVVLAFVEVPWTPDSFKASAAVSDQANAGLVYGPAEVNRYTRIIFDCKEPQTYTLALSVEVGGRIGIQRI